MTLQVALLLFSVTRPSVSSCQQTFAGHASCGREQRNHKVCASQCVCVQWKLVTDSMEQKPSWEADSHSANQEKARHWYVSWASWIQSTSLHSISLTSFPHLRQCIYIPEIASTNNHTMELFPSANFVQYSLKALPVNVVRFSIQKD